MPSVSRFIALSFLVTTALAQSVTPASRITPTLMKQESDQFRLYDSALTLEQMVDQRMNYDPNSGSYLVVNHPRDEAEIGQAPTSDAQHFAVLTANADAVVVGVPTLRASQLTSSHTFIFSEYEIKVKEVYYDKQKISLTPGQDIVVARAGGSVPIAGQRVTAVDPEFPSLRINQPYVLYLHYNAESGTFSLNEDGAYWLHDGKAESGRLHSRHLPSPVAQDDFLKTVKKGVEAGVTK